MSGGEGEGWGCAGGGSAGDGGRLNSAVRRIVLVRWLRKARRAMSARRASPSPDGSVGGRARREHRAPTAYDPSEEAARAQWGGKDAAPPAPTRRRVSTSPRAVEAAAAAPAAPKPAAGTKRRAASPRPIAPEAQRAVAPSWEQDLVRPQAALHGCTPLRRSYCFRPVRTDLLTLSRLLEPGRRGSGAAWINLGLVCGGCEHSEVGESQ